MYAIIFVLLLIVLAAGAFLTHLMSATNRTDRHITVDTVRITAQQGAQVLNACEKETTAGAYTVANLVSSGYLPNGYAQNTPLGPQWGCQVSSGGANGQNVIILLLSGPFTNLAGKGSLASRENDLQTQISWNVAQDIGPQVAAMSNVVVGVLPMGSTTMTSIVNHQQYDLSGLVNAPSYSTPLIAQNLLASAAT
ncbi:hypothetical protein HAP94_18665 [Acidithiobacillus ferrivorans]|nr:hypothetical protein [Acidithiobacillus ferrivorans]